VLDRRFTILQTFQCGSSLTSQFDYLSLSTVHALAIHGLPISSVQACGLGGNGSQDQWRVFMRTTVKCGLPEYESKYPNLHKQLIESFDHPL